MPRHQRLAIVAAVACVLALLGVAARQALPSRAVARHLIVQSAVAAPTTTTTSIEVPVPVTEAPVTAAPTTVTTPPAPTPPTTTRPAPTAPPATAPRPTTPPPTQPTARATGNLGLVVLPPPSSSSGNAADYTLIGYRWNPCNVITVSTSGPDAGTVGGIITELSDLTGLHFMMVSSGGAITVAWGNVGSASEVAQTVWHSIGVWMTAATLTVDLAGVPFLPSVLRHELGHAMGLGHASQSNEVMYPTVGLTSPGDYGTGDRAGLRAVGTAAGGC